MPLTESIDAVTNPNLECGGHATAAAAWPPHSRLRKTKFGRRVLQGMLTTSIFSTMVGMLLPLRAISGAPSHNVFLVKVSYWLPP